MPIFSLNSAEFAWSFTIALAWLLGELVYRYTKIPRISVYGLVGFLAANLSSHVEFLSYLNDESLLLPANIAFGLILFELGYRVNVRWLKYNPWLGVTGVVESLATFIAVYVFLQWMGTSSYVSLSLAVLTMASSPAGILRVINQQRASGQVTERMLHLSAFNCMLAVIAFYVTIALLQTPSTKLSLDDPAIRSVIMLVISMILGALLGVILPVVLRRLGSLAQDATIAFALSVILLVAFTHAMKLSPALAALTFGLTARHRQVTLSYTQRNFGALGDLLTVLLFVYITSALPWQRVLEGAALGVALIAVRLAAKTITIAALAPVSGISLQKGILTGIGLAPFSVFVILTLAQTQYAGIPLASELANLEAIAAMALFLEIIGPILTQLALILANETTQQ